MAVTPGHSNQSLCPVCRGAEARTPMQSQLMNSKRYDEQSAKKKRKIARFDQISKTEVKGIGPYAVVMVFSKTLPELDRASRMLTIPGQVRPL